MQGYMLMDDEFPDEYRSMADHFHIPVVSTVWVVQSLIVGEICEPAANAKLTELFEDDNL